MTEVITIYQIRQAMLDRAPAVIDEILNRAISGKRNLYCNETELYKVWDAVVPMIQQVGDHRKIEAQTCADVIKALGKGQVTVDEALKLMQMLRIQSESELLPEIANKLDAMNS